MTMNVIALIFVSMILIKLVIVGLNPQAWKAVVKAIYAKPLITTALSLGAAIIILSYLLQELTIVQIFASMTLMMALMMVQFAAFGDEIIELTDKFFEDRGLLKKALPSIILWLGLVVWVVYEICI